MGKADQSFVVNVLDELKWGDARSAADPFDRVEKDGDPTVHAGGRLVDEAPGDEKSETEKHLEEFVRVQEDCEFLEKTGNQLSRWNEELSQLTQQDKKASVLAKARNASNAARVAAVRVKKALAAAKTRTETLQRELEGKKVFGSVVLEIRTNVYNYFMKKFFNAHKRFSSLSNDLKTAERSRMKRQLMLVNSEITDATAEEIIDSGQSAEVFLKMITEETELTQELKRLQARTESVKELEASVSELMQMFFEIAALVNLQQETVDNIVMHVESAKGFTGEAVKELADASAYLLAARKKMLCCAIIALIVIGVIVGAVVGAQQ